MDHLSWSYCSLKLTKQNLFDENVTVYTHNHSETKTFYVCALIT